MSLALLDASLEVVPSVGSCTVWCHAAEGKPHDRAALAETSPNVSVTDRFKQKTEMLRTGPTSVRHPGITLQFVGLSFPVSASLMCFRKRRGDE